MKILKSRLARFVIVGVGIFVAWFILYYLSIEPAALDRPFIHFQTLASGKLLNLAGQPAEVYATGGQYMNLIRLAGAGVKVGGECGAIELIVLFGGYVIAIGGRWKNMMWFLPAGMTVIVFMNVLRIAILVALFAYAPEIAGFNHKYTFVILVYAVIFTMWVWWTKNYAGLSAKSSIEK